MFYFIIWSTRSTFHFFLEKSVEFRRCVGTFHTFSPSSLYISQSQGNILADWLPNLLIFNNFKPPKTANKFTNEFKFFQIFRIQMLPFRKRILLLFSLIMEKRALNNFIHRHNFSVKINHSYSIFHFNQKLPQKICTIVGLGKMLRINKCRHPNKAVGPGKISKNNNCRPYNY